MRSSRSLSFGALAAVRQSADAVRLGEANHAPLPPPPSDRDYDPPQPSRTRAIADKVAEKVGGGTVEDGSESEDEEEVKTTAAPPAKDRNQVSWLGLATGTSRAVVATMLGSNRVKASAGPATVSRRLGILSRPAKQSDGPSQFTARFKGKRGFVTVITAGDSPRLAFAQAPKIPGTEAGEQLWAVGLSDITEVRCLVSWSG